MAETIRDFDAELEVIHGMERRSSDDCYINMSPTRVSLVATFTSQSEVNELHVQETRYRPNSGVRKTTRHSAKIG